MSNIYTTPEQMSAGMPVERRVAVTDTALLFVDATPEARAQDAREAAQARLTADAMQQTVATENIPVGIRPETAEVTMLSQARAAIEEAHGRAA